MAVTTNGILALAYIYNDWPSARWNYVYAVGSPLADPAGLGAGVSLSYSFPTTRPTYTDEVGFRAFASYQATAAVQAMKLIEEVARVDFRPASSGIGEFIFAMSTGHGSSGGRASIPSFSATWFQGENIITSVSVSRHSGDVWLNRDLQWTPADFQPGQYGFFTLLHEIGHGLGLKHPFLEPEDPAPYTLDPSLDNHGITMMSYTEAPNAWIYDAATGQAEVMYPTTPMIYDVLALQYLYGKNMATRAGNSTYRWSDKEELLETIWDGGGKDTIDCSNQTLTCWINLDDGSYSSIGLRQTQAEVNEALGIPSGVTFSVPLYNGLNNLAIAFDAVIENASGGSAADRITGNAAHNRLQGNGGRDVLSGAAGRDTLAGGGGGDRLAGGTGADVFDYDRISDSGLGTSSHDVINGFVRGEDKIDLSTIDARPTLAGNQAFAFVTSGFTGAGQVRYSGGQLLVNMDSDIAAEFSVTVNVAGGGMLTAANLIL
jgi:serralysin